jgi:hypothetical protein
MTGTNEQENQRNGLNGWQHGAVFALACLLMATRRPDAVFHAQFLHEDGHVWFADVYNYGWWGGIWRIYEGYHHVFPRAGAALALLVPLALAPLAMNLIGMFAQVLPVNLLLDARSSEWGSLRYRAALGGIYLALPNAREMLNSISQAQWPLTLCAFLLLVAKPPKGPAGRVFDVSVLLLTGLTGPQCVFLLLVALYLGWKRGERWRFVGAGVLGVTCVIQAWGLLSGGFASRPHFPLGASMTMLVRLLAGHVFLGTLLGANALALHSSPKFFLFMCCVLAGGVAMVAFCLRRSTEPLRLFGLLTVVLLAVSLISPTVYPPQGMNVWQLLAAAGGIRYWYFPCIVCAWLLVTGVWNGSDGLKAVSGVLLLLMCFGVVGNWRIPPAPVSHWAEDASRFETLPKGTTVTFQENPPGWDITLTRR